MKRKLLAFFITLAMVLSMTPAIACTAFAVDNFDFSETENSIAGFNLGSTKAYYHNGTAGAVGTLNDVVEGANAIWDPDTKTITLNDFNLVINGVNGIVCADDVQIVVKGADNNISTDGSNACIKAKNKLEIVGDSVSGSKLALSQTGSQAAVATGSELKIAKCSIGASANGNPFAYGIKVLATTGNGTITVNNAALEGNGVYCSSANGKAAITIQSSKADVSSIQAYARHDDADITIKDCEDVKCITSTEKKAPCCIGVYGGDSEEESSTLTIDNSKVTATNVNYDVNSAYMCITVESSWDAYSVLSESIEGGKAIVDIKNGSEVFATNANYTEEAAEWSHRNGAIFMLSTDDAVMNIDNSKVDVIGGTGHAVYGISAQVVRSGHGDCTANITNGSNVVSRGDTGFDVRVWGSNGNSTLNVTDSTLKAYGEDYEGLYVTVCKEYTTDPGVKGKATANFTNSNVVATSTRFSYGFSINKHTGTSSELNVVGGTLTAASTNKEKAIRGVTPNVSNAGIVVIEKYDSNRYEGDGKVYSDFSMAEKAGAYSVADNETVTINLDGKKATLGNIENKGILTITDTVTCGILDSRITTKSGAKTFIQSGHYTKSLVPETGGTVSITGGTFDVNPSDYVAEGYVAVVYKTSPSKVWKVVPEKAGANTTNDTNETKDSKITDTGDSSNLLTCLGILSLMLLGSAAVIYGRFRTHKKKI